MVSFADARTEKEVLGELAGYASLCWGKEGVFQAERAGEAVDAAIKRLHELKLDNPQLGYATTRHLLEELSARIELDGSNGGGGLEYRTVTSG